MDYFYDMSFQAPTQDDIDNYFHSKHYFARKAQERKLNYMKDEGYDYAVDWYEGAADRNA